ncbi:MAG: PDDEXK nuclease domain-containing protein [Candidatus Gastranaerophilales bacterium]|nr:PDDEXK nuclease domain-containing protein [Candidatus Gastranaerophilales bacterium]
MSNEVSKIYSDIAELLTIARTKAYHTVNSIMVETYWKIGQRIIEEEQGGSSRAEYGSELIENLSKYLTDTFGKGFSEANLKNMRQFYIAYPKFDRQCLANLSWSNIARILRIDNTEERNYYLTEAANENWSYRQLERNIKSGYYHRLLSTQEKFPACDKKLPSVKNTKEFVKDPYVLEFLDLPENIEGKENILETALINNLQKFLLELGKGFSFVARQFRISTETDHFYADLVFYNYLLKCFVVIDLKTAKLSHADIGQMDMYVRMFDELKRGVDDNPTIGIILCTDKSETMVKYSVLEESKQIFASKYKTILPTEEELADMIAKENTKLLSAE